MSRHKFVKNLNLDEVLDDFEGGANYEDGGENGKQTPETRHPVRLTKLLDISIEDKSEGPIVSRIISTQARILTPIKLRAGQLQEGTTEVRKILGPDVAVTDQEIQESLWHYYYDVEKTVNYILSMKLTLPSMFVDFNLSQISRPLETKKPKRKQRGMVSRLHMVNLIFPSTLIPLPASYQAAQARIARG